MGECSERLRPDNTKVSYASKVEFSKTAVEDITKKMHAQSSNDSPSTFVAAIISVRKSSCFMSPRIDLLVVGNPAEGEGHGNLEEETNGCHGVASEGSKAEAADDGRRVGVESTLRSVVAESNEEMSPKTPVGELDTANSQ